MNDEGGVLREAEGKETKQMTSTTFPVAPRMSRHAARRAMKRGIRARDIQMLFVTADTALPVGDRCEAWRLSKEAAAELIADGHPPALVERVSRISVVWSGSTGAIVTCLRPQRGRCGARYRRPWHGRNRTHR